MFLWSMHLLLHVALLALDSSLGNCFFLAFMKVAIRRHTSSACSPKAQGEATRKFLHAERWKLRELLSQHGQTVVMTMRSQCSQDEARESHNHTTSLTVSQPHQIHYSPTATGPRMQGNAFVYRLRSKEYDPSSFCPDEDTEGPFRPTTVHTICVVYQQPSSSS